LNEDRATDRGRAWIAVVAGSCLALAAYAGSFLYFFVDDEAIPLVYARNLLRGRGLVYTALEGRGEGYSDFLHVLWSTAVLYVTTGLHLTRLAPLLVGKAVSLAAGAGILVTVGSWLRRAGATMAGVTAALGFLALAGPLAVWSCSSLETVPFALMVTGLAATLLTDSRPAAILLAMAIVFERLDGMLYVAVLLLAALIADRRRWRDVSNVAWPVCLAALAFHAWRWSFFGSLLSEPLAAKVLYRLSGSSQIVVKSADVPYLLGLLRVYGWPAAPALGAAIVLAWRLRAARMAALALLALGLYVSVVGDWMFGWRFTVALLPLTAVTIGLAVSRAPRTFGWCAAVVIVMWSGFAARRFLEIYVRDESRPVYWTHSGLGAPAWLGRYHDVVRAGRPLMHGGDRVAYNQAGLLPYLLDLENIDDLGICSRFVARLPTTDVYYTGVGRYSPLTNQPVLRTAHAYLLHRDVKFLIAPADLLWKANGDTIPPLLLDGHFALETMDASGQNAIYRRTGKPADRYQHDPTAFWENLTHVSRLTRAAVDGKALAPEAYGTELPFLRERAGTRTFAHDLEIDLSFDRQDADVYALYIGRIDTKEPLTMSLSLFDSSGRETLKRSVLVSAAATSVLERLDAPVRARSASLKFDTAEGDRLVLDDLRIEGQSAALRDYVRRELRFR
jgi:hypothetical protein